jgi:hypothetical protein
MHDYARVIFFGLSSWIMNYQPIIEQHLEMIKLSIERGLVIGMGNAAISGHE